MLYISIVISQCSDVSVPSCYKKKMKSFYWLIVVLTSILTNRTTSFRFGTERNRNMWTWSRIYWPIDAWNNFMYSAVKNVKDLLSQIRPKNPRAHLQWKTSSISWQWPPLRHGLLWHNFSSERTKDKKEFSLCFFQKEYESRIIFKVKSLQNKSPQKNFQSAHLNHQFP